MCQKASLSQNDMNNKEPSSDLVHIYSKLFLHCERGIKIFLGCILHFFVRVCG